MHRSPGALPPKGQRALTKGGDEEQGCVFSLSSLLVLSLGWLGDMGQVLALSADCSWRFAKETCRIWVTPRRSRGCLLAGSELCSHPWLGRRDGGEGEVFPLLCKAGVGSASPSDAGWGPCLCLEGGRGLAGMLRLQTIRQHKGVRGGIWEPSKGSPQWSSRIVCISPLAIYPGSPSL